MRKSLICPLLLVNLTVLIVSSLLMPEYYNEDYLKFILCIAIIGVLCPFVLKDDNSVCYFNIRPITFFLFGYFIVFFQLPIDLALGKITTFHPCFVNVGLINKSVTYSAIGLYSFLIGYFFYKMKKKSHNSENLYIYDVAKFRVLFLIASFLNILFTLQNVFSGVQYNQEMLEKSAGGIQNYSSILFMTSFYALLTVHTNNLRGASGITLKQYFKALGFYPSVLLAIVSISLLLLGSRSPIIVIASSLAFSYLYVSHKRISWFKIVLTMVIASYVMMFVAVSRVLMGAATVEEKYSMMQTKVNNGNSIINPTLEYAGSLKTFNYALQYVPEKHDYLLGNFQMRSIFAAIPFSARLTNNFLDNNKKYVSSAFFITHIVQGKNYLWGEGTSILADLYLDFGILGIAVGMFFLGLFFRILEYHIFVKTSTKNNIFYLAMMIVLMGNSFVYSRFSFLDFLNYMMFALIFIAWFTRRERHYYV